MTKVVQSILYASITILVFTKGLLAQSPICYGIIPDTITTSNQMVAGCSNDSAAYLNKYRLQSHYVPTNTDPLITLKVTLHVFCDDQGNGRFVNDPSLPWDSANALGGVGQARIQFILRRILRFPNLNPSAYPSGTYFSIPANTDYYDRWSAPRQANYYVPGLDTGHTVDYDSRIRYEVTNIYFYNDSVLQNTNAYYNNKTPFYTAIGLQRLEEGLPIIYNNENFTSQTSWYLSQKSGPCIFTPINLYDNNFMEGTLSHEIGHCFGLYHSYYGGKCNLGNPPVVHYGYPCLYAFSPETHINGVLNCTNLDYLYDVFPTNNPNASANSNPFPLVGTNPPLSSCTSNYEVAPMCTNNVMSDNAAFPFRFWMSPLQMGRRVRNLHLLSGIRQYAKDFVSDHTNPWEVDTAEVWDFDIQMYRDIVVKSGKKLTIQCKVAMPINGKILVENGAQLVIDGGEVTGWCKNGLWGGIEVSGTSSQGQVVNNTNGFAQNHGVVRVINGGKITKAQNGIKNFITDAYGNIQWNKTGGVIIGNGGVFENNVRDVEFISYQSTFGNDASYFINCDFKTTVSAQPFPYAHVTMWAVRGIQFRGCNFEYTPTGQPHRGIGIHSMDAIYSIDKYISTPTTFVRLKQGVRVNNTNPLKIVNIKNTTFIKNELDGAYFQMMNNFLFEKNDLQSFQNPLSNGLYLNNCKGYKVMLNSFHEPSGQVNKTSSGIRVFKSEGGSHGVYKNRFYDLGVGANIMDNNSSNISTDDGLKLNCNDFTISSNIYDIALTKTTGLNPPTVMRQQGEVQPFLQNANNLVRNMYGASCGNQNKWFIDSSSSKVVDHGSNTQNFTQMVTQPSCGSNLVYDVPSNISLIYSTHCLDYPSSSGGGGTTTSQKLAVLNSHLTELMEINVDNDHYFEIQSTLSSKLEVFLTDTLISSIDSVISVLESYPDYIQDADIQIVFAYLNKGDLTKAQAKVNALNSIRADWADLLNVLIDIEEDENKIFSLRTNTATVNFLEAHITDGKDGQSVAKSLLSFVLGEEFEDPRLFPIEGGGERRFLSYEATTNSLTSTGDFIEVYPNPSQSTFVVKSDEILPGESRIEVKDLLGRAVYTERFTNFTSCKISLNGLSNGIYMLRITNLNGLLYQTKLIKQH
ncbi:MAG: zinc-dependent metalloprotease [Bacteroidia bacterium]|jgi:hypothetical protein|nr:zinc-dependent metalloprotease [Bacteroidia bacterium]